MNETTPRLIDLMTSPWEFFESPEKVLTYEHLDAEQKRRALESWKLDAELRMTATTENMAGGGGADNDLRAVSKCLEQLS